MVSLKWSFKSLADKSTAACAFLKASFKQKLTIELLLLSRGQEKKGGEGRKRCSGLRGREGEREGGGEAGRGRGKAILFV